jgi:hypothetical protein
MPLILNGSTGISGIDGSAGTPSYQGSDSNTGIFYPAADTIAFAEGGAESMRIDSSGRLLLGNSTSNNLPYIGNQFAPGFQNYAVSGTGGFYRYSANSDPCVLTFAKSRNATIGSQTVVSSGDNLGYIGFAGSDGTNFITAASIIGMVDGTPGTNDMPGRLVFTTTADGASSPTERMRITSAGNVGIGTSSPSSLLTVKGEIRREFASNTALYTLVNYDGISVVGAQDAYYLVASGQNQTWYVGATERMRITSGGDVLVGATATINGGKLYSESSTTPAEFYSTGATTNATMFVEKSVNDSTTANVFVRFFINNGAAGSGQINANGASAAAFGTYSDARLKENIEDLPTQLQNITALRPVEFDYKVGGHQIGFVAQEMQQIYPDTVGEGEDGMLTITGWDKTTARLVKAIQEQQQIINDLKARIETLESN